MNENRRPFLTAGVQLVNVGERVGFENHLLAITALITASGETPSSIIKLVAENNERYSCIASESLLTRDLLITKGKNGNFIMERTGRHCLN